MHCGDLRQYNPKQATDPKRKFPGSSATPALSTSFDALTLRRLERAEVAGTASRVLTLGGLHDERQTAAAEPIHRVDQRGAATQSSHIDVGLLLQWQKEHGWACNVPRAPPGILIARANQRRVGWIVRLNDAESWVGARDEWDGIMMQLRRSHNRCDSDCNCRRAGATRVWSPHFPHAVRSSGRACEDTASGDSRRCRRAHSARCDGTAGPIEPALASGASALERRELRFLAGVESPVDNAMHNCWAALAPLEQLNEGENRLSCLQFFAAAVHCIYCACLVAVSSRVP